MRQPTRTTMPGFSTRLISKDLNLATQLIERLGLSSTTLTEASRRIYGALEKSEYSGKDFSVVYKYISDLNRSAEINARRSHTVDASSHLFRANQLPGLE